MTDCIEQAAIHRQRAADLLGGKREQPLLAAQLEELPAVLAAHRAFRTRYQEYFATPDAAEAAFFVLEELTEAANALCLNDGRFTRNGDGRHKAQPGDALLELAELFLMLDTFYGYAPPLVEFWQQVADRLDVEPGSLETLGRMVCGAVQAVLDPQIERPVRLARITLSMAYILTWPDFDVAHCRTVLDKWTHRAKRKQLRTLADELDVYLLEAVQ